MGRFIAIGFIALPLVEIALFIVVGRAIGVLPTLALVLLAAFAGAMLLRQQGLGVLNRMRSNFSAATLPGEAVFDAMALGVAAVLLVLPGFLTDVLALLLLIPAVRHALFANLRRRVRVVETTTTTYRYAGNPPDEPGPTPLIEVTPRRPEDGA